MAGNNVTEPRLGVREDERDKCFSRLIGGSSGEGG